MRSKSAAVINDGSGATSGLPLRLRISAAIPTGSAAAISP
jgi:hypothetical protein